MLFGSITISALVDPCAEFSPNATPVPQESNELNRIRWAGRFDEITAVLRRITNAPVYIPLEAFAQPRPVRRTGNIYRSIVTSVYTSWRESWQMTYFNLPTRTSDDVLRSGSGASSDEDEFGVTHGNGRSMSFDSGVMHVVCPGNDRALRRSVVVLIVVWFTISYGTYGVATWNNQLFADIGLSNPYLCSFIYALSSLPGNVCSILLVERVRNL